ncbi:MAG TPA: signal recognition particle-docking protein FtsY [Rectinemataceae bacterium]|nr:signal recognition particle-docking protein FtsY [Rectinemataceae bacterium]
MAFADRIRALFGKTKPGDAEFFEELADLLVEGDLGASLAMGISETLRKNCIAKGLSGETAIKGELRRLLSEIGRVVRIEPEPDRFNVFLLLGVNGVGKTTSAAKLASKFKKPGEEDKIILAAGDTFRAAAIEQLRHHGARLGIKVIAQEQGSDPAAVIYDAISAALASGATTVIADTAGRMHTRNDLVRELGKIDRIITTRTPGANIKRLLVIDATTGQNGLRQAETFGSAVPVDGLILTKFDSSAKGGLVLAISKELGIPTAWVGTGEGHGDFKPFELESFLDDFIGKGQ